MGKLCLIAAFLCTTADAQQTDATIFQTALISSGKNRPAISIRAENLAPILGLLHRRAPLAQIESQLGLTETELRRKLDLLIGEGLAKRTDDQSVRPTCVVVTRDDAAMYFHPDNAMVREATELLRKKLQRAKTEVRSIPSLSRVPFQSISFLIGSNVFLDNWQINNVERLFLNAERPQRAGGRYYLMEFEKPTVQQSEAFGIYGNTGTQWGDVEIGLYGNDRFTPGRTVLSIPDDQFAEFFGLDPHADLKRTQAELARRIVDASRGRGALTGPELRGLSKLGLARNGKPAILVFDRADYQALDRLAATVTGDLIELLERNRSHLMERYSVSPYAEETSFNEYFMCWYHFFYTAVTDTLKDQRAIDIPPNGTTTYFVVSR